MKKVISLLIRLHLIMLICTNIVFADLGSINVGGFISQGFSQTSKNNYFGDTSDGTFQFNEMGVYFKTSLANNLSIGCQFFGRDLGEIGNNEIGLNWAFAEKKWCEKFGLRAGLIKIPAGLHNETRDMDMFRTFIYLPSSVYNEWLRDGIDSLNGIEVFGKFNLGSFGLLQYRIQDGEVNISPQSGTARFYLEILKIYQEFYEVNVGNLFTSKLCWLSPINGLQFQGFYAITNWAELKGSLRKTNMPIIINATKLIYIFLSMEYIWRDFTVAAEYYSNLWSGNVKSESGEVFIPPSENNDRGYYMSVAYEFCPYFELGSYFSYYKRFENNRGAFNEMEDICISLKYSVNETWRSSWTVKLECHKMHGLFGVEPEKENVSMDEDWYLYAAKLTYSF